MINPDDITTVRVSELPPADFNLTDNVPHEIGTELYRGTINQLADFIGSYLGTTDSLAFNPTTVSDGGTLPATTSNEWMLVGKGTFHNVGGGSDIITTEELNAVTSNGAYWSLAVQIPINVELAGITQNIRSGYTQTAPSEDAVFNRFTEIIALIPGTQTTDAVVNVSGVYGATASDALEYLQNVKLDKAYESNYNVADNNSIISGTTFDAFGILVQSLKNKIFMLYREGDGHLSPVGKIVMRTSTDGGKTFSARTIIHQEIGVDCRNVAGGVTTSGRIIIFFLKYINPTCVSQGTMYSDDDGATWSNYTIQSKPTGATFFSPYGNMIIIDNRRLAIPYYAILSDGSNATFLKFSDDNGDNWSSEVTVATDLTNGYNEASYAYLDGGVILCVVRRQDQILLRQFVSLDNGQTWTNLGNISSSNTQNVAPWLNVYTESNGEKYVALFSSLRGVGAGVNGVVAKKSEVILSSSAWLAETRTLLNSSPNADSGYPSVINPRGGKKMLGMSYSALTFADPLSAVANYKFWNYTPNAVVPAMNGTTNVLQKKTGNASLSDSKVFDDGLGFVGINTIAPISAPTGQTLSIKSTTTDGTALIELSGNTATDGTRLGGVYFGNFLSPTAVSSVIYATKEGANNTADLHFDVRGAGGYRSNAIRIFNSGGIGIGSAATDLGNTNLNIAGKAQAGVAASVANDLMRKGETDTALGLKANLASPPLTGTPTAPTATAGTNTTQIATTAFVNSALPTSGTYIPTLNAISAAINTLSFGNATYTKVGNIVTVTVGATFTVATASISSGFTITYPFNRVTGSVDKIGVSNISNTSYTVLSPAIVEGLNTTTCRVVFYTPIAGNYIAYVSFQYTVL